MEIALLQHPWHAVRALSRAEERGHVVTGTAFWPRFALYPSELILRLASSGHPLPASDLGDASTGQRLLAEIPMPAVGGDAAFSDGLELWDDNTAVAVAPIGYPARYPVGDSDNGHGVSEYEALFDRLLNETLFLVRQLLQVDRPRSPTINWQSLLDALRDRTDDDPARHSLIVDLAASLTGPLDHVTSRPKRMLKRIRDQQRVQMVQEVDTHCLMDLASRPGSTMPEKAGPKQRILAVTRQETIDLLENRVARHCCELVHRAAGRYLKAHAHVQHSARKSQVVKLMRASSRLPKKPQFRGVGRLATPCRSPNYVLMQNVHYSPVWQAYTKLVRNEELRDVLWRWPRRLWADRVGLYVAAAVLRWAEQSSYVVCIGTVDRTVQARTRHVFGHWLLDDTMPGPFVVGKDADRTGSLYVTDGPQASAVDVRLGSSSLLNADYIVFWIGPASVRILPVYAVWPSPLDQPRFGASRDERMADDVLESIGVFNRQAKRSVAIGALLVHPSRPSSGGAPEWHATTRAGGACWEVAVGTDVSTWLFAAPDGHEPFNALIGS